MTQPGNYDILKNYFAGQTGSGPAQSDVAKYILLNAQPKKLGPGEVKSSSNGLVSRLLDILSRTNYASAEFVRNVVSKNETAGLDDIWAGLSGKKKTTYSDVLKEAGMESGVARGVLGFAGDVLLDPLTYVGGAGIASKASKLKGAEEAVTDVVKPVTEIVTGPIPDVLKAAVPVGVEKEAIKLPISDTAPKAGEIPVEKIPSGQQQLPFPDLQVVPPKKKDRLPVEERPKGERGQQTSLRFPDFSVKAERAKAAEASKLISELSERAPEQVAKIAAGDIQQAIKMTPLPPPVVASRHVNAANEILAKWNGNKATAQINRQFPDTLNAKQQVKLWHKAREAANKLVFKKNRDPETVAKLVNEETTKIYSQVEKTLREQGLVPRIGTGENVRLMDVIADLTMRGMPVDDAALREFASSIKPGSEVWKSVEVLRARGALQDSATVKLVADKVGEAHAAVKTSGVFPESQQKDFTKFLKDFAANTAKESGVSPASATAARHLVDMTLNSGKSAAQLAVDMKAAMLEDVVAKGKASTEVNHVVTKALEKDLGTLPAWAINDNKGMEFLMGRVATWWGQSDLRPLSLNAIGSSHATAATRGKVLDDMFAPYTEPQRFEAWKVLQGYGTASTPEVAELASRMNVVMENLVSQVSGASVLLRSGVHKDMLNKWMKEYHVGFEFTGGKRKNMLGETVDYSKGTDWLQSWKTANIKEDPKCTIFKLQQAMEQATREKALFDEIGERFGTTAPGKGSSTRVTGYPYIEGYYFPAEIAQQIPRVVKDWSPAAWKNNAPLLRHYDRVLSMVKSGLTIYRPGHHFRNFVGDVYLGWMDGVNTLRPYQLATQVQKSMRGAYKTIQDVDNLIELGAVSRNLKTPDPNQILFKNKSGVGFTAEQIAAVAHQKGLLENAKTLEDIIDMGSGVGGKKNILDVQPFGGKVQAVARGASELFSHNTRLAHFIDKVMKSRGSDLSKIFEDAANRSRKWHPTGLDLTDFEKKYMRRILPFYSWMRKSLPLLIEGMVMNPGKTIIPAKLYDAMQDMAGIETPGRHDPFPVDQMFPEWIRESGFGPVGLPDGLLGNFSNQEPPGYVMAGMGLDPLTELLAQIQNPGKTIASSLTPAIQIPVELLTGRKIFTGEQFIGDEAREGAFAQWTGEQIPIFSAVQGITGITPFGTQTRKAENAGMDAGTEAFMNWLTGAGIKGTGPYIRQARYEKRIPYDMKNKELKEDFINRLKEGS